jgi:1-acyl-sn-glycerol-3-phosphate acyltransferase
MSDSSTPPNPFATAFFTVAGNAVFVLASLVFGFTSAVLGWLPPRGRWMYLSAWLWSHVVVRTAGLRVKVRYAAPLASEKGYVFMPNHLSMMDIPVLLMTLPGETRMLAKRSLFRIPIFGWGLTAGGFIPVDRRDRSSAKETFDAAVRCLEQGRSILIFPEESRSLDGRLLPFKPGGFLIALKTGFPIVPVGLNGTFEARPRGSFVNRPQRVEVRYGEPIDVAAYGVRRKKQLMEEVRARVLELSGPSRG